MSLSKRNSAMQRKRVQDVALKAGAVAMALLFVLASALSVHAQASKTQQSQQILSPVGETSEHDQFGTAVAISRNGNTMVIGSETADGNVVAAGAAYIFDKMGGSTWVQTAKVFAADGAALPAPGRPGEFQSDSFGLTVAISEDGNTVIAGAPNHNHRTGIPGGDQGAVYVFQRTDGVWNQQAELLSPNPNLSDNFGNQSDFGGIAISGNTIVVTDQGNIGSGLGASVDVFVKVNGVWTLSTQLSVADDPNFLPSSIAFDGRTLVVGSDISDASSAFSAGAVYVFQFNEGQWSAPVTLTAADATSFGTFGYNVSLSGNLIVVGAAFGPGTTAQSGAAYVFTRDEEGWSQKAKLIASDGLDFDNFGVSVSVSGQTALVGAQNHTPSVSGAFGAGATYVFRPNDEGIWQQIVELSASDAISGGTFGSAVAMLNNTLLVGASAQHPPVEGYPGGEAYVYRLNP